MPNTTIKEHYRTHSSNIAFPEWNHFWVPVKFGSRYVRRRCCCCLCVVSELLLYCGRCSTFVRLAVCGLCLSVAHTSWHRLVCRARSVLLWHSQHQQQPLWAHLCASLTSRSTDNRTGPNQLTWNHNFNASRWNKTMGIQQRTSQNYEHCDCWRCCIRCARKRLQ